jgi:putative ABC transport system substrate-binding protein
VIAASENDIRGFAMKHHLLRTLLTLAAGILLLPLDASAQTVATAYRIGVLGMTPPDLSSPFDRAFYEELRQRGYVEGKNLSVERRNAAGQPDRLPALARELVALRPDLIVAGGPQPNRAVKDATSTIPIVMILVADPVKAGLVASLPHPGGNLTGVSSVVPGGIMAKTLDYLHQIAPKATRIGMLINPTNAMHRELVPLEIPDAARRLGLDVHIVEARTSDEVESAINAAVGKGAEALFIHGDPVWNNPPERVPQLVARTGLPAIYFLRTQAQAGGLMSFGPDFPALGRRAASYVDRILKGAKPGDLAVEQPTKIDLVINLKTAKALGLAIPQSLRVEAELIE